MSAVWKSDLHNRESLGNLFDFLQELLIISEATLSTIPRGWGEEFLYGTLVRKLKFNPQGRPMWVWFKLKLIPKETMRYIFVNSFM